MENVELDEVQWRSPEWIQFNGLRTDNVLDYFSLSPFYDRSSNNQVLKMQTNFNEQFQTRPADPASELKKMKGVEYQVTIAREPDLWVIRKQFRKSPTEVDTLADYFVSGENVYQSPSVYNVLVSRILATSKYLEEALRIAEKLPEFTFSGYDYQRSTRQIGTESTGTESTETEPTGTEPIENSNSMESETHIEEERKTPQEVYQEKLRIPSVLENALQLSLQYLNSGMFTETEEKPQEPSDSRQGTVDVNGKST